MSTSNMKTTIPEGWTVNTEYGCVMLYPPPEPKVPKKYTLVLGYDGIVRRVIVELLCPPQT